MKKKIFILPLVLVFIIGGMLYTANRIRPLGNPRLNDVSFLSLKLNHVKENDSLEMENLLRSTGGITAVTINIRDQFAGLSYEASRLKDVEILEMINQSGFSASFNTGSVSKCPIAGFTALKYTYRSYFSFLDK